MTAPYSIVTAARNRTAQLRITAASISRFGSHAEHLIVDWSSHEPITTADLPADPRLRLLRVEGERAWWLSRAYNRGFCMAACPWILKADADAVLGEAFFRGFDPAVATLQLRHMTSTLTGKTNLDDLGLFSVDAAALRAVRGFNPWLVGWGVDDIDLFERLFVLPGTRLAHLGAEGVHCLPHGDALRLGAPETADQAVGPMRRLSHRLQLQARLEANRTLAALARSGCLPSIPEPMGQEPAELLQRLPPPLLARRHRALLAGLCRPLVGRASMAVARVIPSPWLPPLLTRLGLADPLP